MGSFIREYFGVTAYQMADMYWPAILPLPVFFFLKKMQIAHGLALFLAGLVVWLPLFLFVVVPSLAPVLGTLGFLILWLVPWIWAVVVFRYLRNKTHGNEQAITGAGGS